MHIGILGFPTMGGSGMMAARLAKELSEKGHEVTMVSFDTPFFLKEHKNPSFRFVKIPRLRYELFKQSPPTCLMITSTLNKLAREEHVDVFHAHYAIPFVNALYLSKAMNNVKTVLTLHGSDVHMFGKLEHINPTLSYLIAQMDEVTAVSHYLGDLAREVFQLQKPKVIYNFIDTDIFHPNYPLIKPDHVETLMIHASNFRPIKNISFVIKAFADVYKDLKDSELWLVGDGPECMNARQMVMKLGIQDQVKYLGVRQDIPKLFASSDILLAPSLNESFGLTIAEAMSAETAIWASNRGGIPEVVTHGDTGFLFDLENEKLACDYLRVLADDKGLRERFKRNARMRVLKRFHKDVIIHEYTELYEEII